MKAGNVLVVDDEPAIRKALKTTLGAFGFEVQEASNGESALVNIRESQVDAVLLDINMPGIGGIQTCHSIRQRTLGIGILMLTVRDSIDDLEAAFDAGADDYITKPFHFREVAARLRALIRRSRSQEQDPAPPLSIGDVALDSHRRIVRKSGFEVHLTPKEFELLHYLMRHAGVPITHSKLLRAVWGVEYGNETEYLRTFVRQLRVKIEDDPSSPSYLMTVPFVGYRFSEESSAKCSTELADVHKRSA